MNEWTKYKETTQALAVLMLDTVALGYKKYFRKFHDGRIEIGRYGQMMNGRWMGSRDLKNYEQMMSRATPEELHRWAKKYRLHGAKILAFSQNISKTDFKHYSAEKIRGVFSKYIGLSATAFHFAYDYVMLNKTYSEMIGQIILKVTKNESSTSNYLPYVAGLEKPTDMHAAQKELGKLALLAKNGKLETGTKERIKKYCEGYGYLDMFTYFGDPSSEKEITRKVWNLARKDEKVIEREAGAQIRQLAVNRKKTKEFLKKYKIAERDRKSIGVLKDYVYTSMWADEIYHRIPYLVRSFIREIGKRLGISYNQLIHMTADEILESLQKNMVSERLLKKINERTKEFIFLYDNGETKVLSGNELAKFKRKILKREMLPSNIKELKGEPAFSGKIKGAVQVVRKMEDIKKFKRGRILVAASTAPVHVPAMERASAFITDEGGLLSHAAIVSREFKKPCVVGTKIATRVLRDGDLVEVDADKGIVEIIKKR